MTAPSPALDLSLAGLRARLAAHEPSEPITRVVAPRRASVAVVLRYTSDTPDVLLMQRATRTGDRWSGHVSFPGGREEERDRDLRATAIRETREELGVDLETSAQWIGRLDGISAIARGKILPMTIAPHVFVQTGAMTIALGPEAAASFWLPLQTAAAGALDDHHVYQLGPTRLKLPCWNYEGRVVWGLTYRMLQDLLRVAGS